MVQKNIRDWGGTPYSNAEADELTQELNDRTVSSQDGYNSVDELATKVKAAETNINLKEDKSGKGVANGYAELDSGGRVPAAQIPGSVDEVQEYANLASFPVTGLSDVIYVALDTNKTYRWGGTVYVELSSGSLVLGETSTTAYRGDRGKEAYDHSLTAHAPSDAEANQTDAEIKTQYEANADTNPLTDALLTKLNQIEDGATADQDLSNYPELDSNNSFSGSNTFAVPYTTFGDSSIPTAGLAFQFTGAAGQNNVAMTSGQMNLIVSGNVGATIKSTGLEAPIDPTTGAGVGDRDYNDSRYTKSDVSGEPTGSDRVLNVVSLTQAEYDAGSKNATTFYVITDA